MLMQHLLSLLIIHAVERTAVENDFSILIPVDSFLTHAVQRRAISGLERFCEFFHPAIMVLFVLLQSDPFKSSRQLMVAGVGNVLLCVAVSLLLLL